MPAFRYVAIDRSGALQRGVMDAPDEAVVVERLRHQGSIPMRAEPAGGRNFFRDFFGADLSRMAWGGRRGLSRQDVANMTRELAIMLAAGQDLDGALRFLVETAPNRRVRAAMDTLRASVRDGSALADALARHPENFSNLYVGLVRAGEAGGRLAETLDRLALMLERQRALSATVQSALIYPTLLLLTAIGAIVLMLTTVLPQFVPLFEQNGAKLPDSTRLLISAGDFVATDGIFVLAGLVLAGLAAKFLLRRPGPRLAADRMALRLPLVGGLLREVLAARFTRTLGTLVINGVPLIAALGIVREVMGNHAAIEAVEQATVSARGGAGLARPLAEAKIFPTRTAYLLRLGEENAQLGPMALRAADIHEDRTRRTVERLLSLLVPAITVLMGVAVAAIVAALLLAMLSLNDLAA